ncbi:hypothetical protein ABTX81_30390 [Kitasatospora sp. NPDC097605]|uniref:hypothetical protein n=1 Tax=Kitasatospora sp. NPDC097605 TaxID=3157226 RepID=UPI00331AFECD
MSAVPRHGLTWCRTCLQQVRRTTTAAGRVQYVDPEPNDNGNVVARLDATGTWHSRVPDADLPQAPYERRFMPHAATCTAAGRTLAPARLPDNVASLDARRRRRNTPPTLF